MHFATSLIAALAATALAAPPTYPSEVCEAPHPANITTAPPGTVDAEPLVSKRENPSATYCEHTMRTSPCATFTFESAKCYNLPIYWNDKISSLFPSSRSDRCTVFSDANCQGKTLTIPWPGINRMSDKDMNDQISSIECFKV